MAGPLIIAHRGASAHAPENTIVAFRMGIDAGAEGVELDVRLSKDGIPVVMHDRDLRRLAGRPELVKDLTAAELAALDLGTHFHSQGQKRFQKEFAREGVPSLAQVLELFAPTSGVVHLELKIDHKTEIKHLVSAVCDLLRSSDMRHRVIVSSFVLAAIAEAKFSLTDLKTSALFAPSIMRVLKRRRHMISLAKAFDADGISPHRSLITRKLVRLTRDAGMPVTIWTCDRTKWITTASRLGIANVITNDPGKLIAARSALISDIRFG